MQPENETAASGPMPAAPAQPAVPQAQAVAPAPVAAQPAPVPAEPPREIDPELQNSVNDAVQAIAKIREGFSTTIVGQGEMLDSILVALISNGHVLIEGVPGLAKTTAVRAIAATMDANFVRIQCTPDMLPSDILGNQIYNPQDHKFITQIGPIDHQFVLVDEINRTGAKTQSALLEAMQERQISIGGETHKLPDGFIVLATQNPIEQEGTYLLPEAQLDRFLIKHLVTYPTLEEEIEVMKVHDSSGSFELPKASTDIKQILDMQKLAKQIVVDDKILTYIGNVVAATRDPSAYNLADLAPYIEVGASPRASLALVAAGRANALMQGSTYVTPDHIKPYLARVLRHRVALTYEADAENVTADQLIERIGAGVVVP